MATLTLTAEVTFIRSGRATLLVQPGGTPVQSASNSAPFRPAIHMRRWWAVLREGSFNMNRFGFRERVGNACMTRVLRLALFSPEITTAILEEQLRVEITAGLLNAPVRCGPAGRDRPGQSCLALALCLIVCFTRCLMPARLTMYVKEITYQSDKLIAS